VVAIADIRTASDMRAERQQLSAVGNSLLAEQGEGVELEADMPTFGELGADSGTLVEDTAEGRRRRPWDPVSGMSARPDRRKVRPKT
jgi:hypothetical protein